MARSQYESILQKTRKVGEASWPGQNLNLALGSRFSAGHFFSLPTKLPGWGWVSVVLTVCLLRGQWWALKRGTGFDPAPFCREHLPHSSLLPPQDSYDVPSSGKPSQLPPGTAGALQRGYTCHCRPAIPCPSMSPVPSPAIYYGSAGVGQDTCPW